MVCCALANSRRWSERHHSEARPQWDIHLLSSFRFRSYRMLAHPSLRWGNTLQHPKSRLHLLTPTTAHNF